MDVDMSAAVQRFHRVCAAIEAVVCDDVGRRGIAAFTLPHQLPRAAASFLTSPSVIILTGFPCLVRNTPPTETDGPPGAVALAKAALLLGKRVAIATDDCNADVLRACAAARLGNNEIQGSSFELLSFPPTIGESGKAAAWAVGSDASKRLARAIGDYQHAVAIERAGAAADGGYYTMRAISMSALVAPLDPMVTVGCACGVEVGVVEVATRSSTGIGDGGNEVGMGLVVDAVRAHVANGPAIACVTPADALLTVGVSNWGGWALAAAVEALARSCSSGAGQRRDGDGVYRAADAPPPAYAEAVATAVRGGAHLPPLHARALLEASPPGLLLPTADEETSLAAAMCAAGAADGISGARDGAVDGLPLSSHLTILARLRAVLTDAFGPQCAAA